MSMHKKFINLPCWHIFCIQKSYRLHKSISQARPQNRLMSSHSIGHSKKIPVAWYWKLRNELRCFSEYLQESTTRCIAQLVLFWANVPGTFFNATHQERAIAIGIVEVNPLGELTDCSTSVHLRVFLTNLSEFYVKDLLPYTHFYMALYSRFSYKSGTLLHVLFFCLK